MELGLGIHGEPGAETAPLRPVDEIVAQVLLFAICELAMPALIPYRTASCTHICVIIAFGSCSAKHALTRCSQAGVLRPRKRQRLTRHAKTRITIIPVSVQIRIGGRSSARSKDPPCLESAAATASGASVI